MAMSKQSSDRTPHECTWKHKLDTSVVKPIICEIFRQNLLKSNVADLRQKRKPFKKESDRKILSRSMEHRKLIERL